MIIGTGIDIIEINRIEKISVKRAFLNKFFTATEIEYLSNKKPESTAGYFCAKEAVVKALGTGFSGFKFTDIEILKCNDVPSVSLHNNAFKIACEMGIETIKVSISHCKEYATAVAIAEGNVIMSVGVGKLNAKKKNYPLSLMHKRSKEGHKGDYGKVCIIGGSYCMSGAIILSSRAALRTGAGLVTCVLPPSILDRVGASVIEATYHIGAEENGFLVLCEEEIDNIISKSNVIAVGVGMGSSKSGESIITHLVKNSDKPLVIDADGINMLAEKKECLKESKVDIVLTPHAGEMARLTSNSIEYINNNREKVALEFAIQYNCIVLLKGNRTIVTDGNKIYINETGNSGMASGGSGDVLTGIIASFIGQGYSVYEASILGAYIHGYGGDMAYEKYGNGLVASDILDNIGECLK